MAGVLFLELTLFIQYPLPAFGWAGAHWLLGSPHTNTTITSNIED
ncbi:hypothetical protein [Caldivirga sp. UBA161]|nr:hypothetical protein [Caldivirga sp. UBA161]